MSYSSGRQGQPDGSPSSRAKVESLSPPPPRPVQISVNDDSPPRRRLLDIDENSPARRRAVHRRLPSSPGNDVISAAEAVASALSLAPAIRRRVEAEAIAEGQRQGIVVEVSVEVPEERSWNSHDFLDLAPIAESPNEVVPERTPEVVPSPAAEARESGRPLDSPVACGTLPEMSPSYASTQVGMQSPFASSPSSTPNLQNQIDRRLRKALRPEKPPKLEIGGPVSFYLEGCPRHYVGWLKAVGQTGLHTVDLVGGGRMTGLDVVTPCKRDELEKAEKEKQHVITSDDPYANYDTRNTYAPCASPTRQFAIGDAVSFTLEKLEHSHMVQVTYPERFFGHVQKLCTDGSYIVELPGGGRKTGVRHMAPCAERDYELVSRTKNGWITRKDELVETNTRNAPSWGGGCGYSSGYRERSPPSRSRSLGRSASMSSLSLSQSVSIADVSASSANRAIQKRSLSPQLYPRARGDNPALRGADNSSAVSARKELEEGSPVYFFLEGHMEAFFGNIRFTDPAGLFTVEIVGGRRIVGLRDVTPCSAADVERVYKSKVGLVTRLDSLDALNSRNRPSSRSPSPQPCLRGVAINLPPRSATK